MPCNDTGSRPRRSPTTAWSSRRGSRVGPAGAMASRPSYSDLGYSRRTLDPTIRRRCGKVERIQQTLKRWLDAKRRPSTIAGLQRQLDEFKDEYNSSRPHTSLRPVRTPASAYLARPKAAPRGSKRRPTLPRAQRHRGPCREGHASLPGTAPQHRDRPPPRANPRHPARPGPRRPCRRRHNRRAPQRADDRPLQAIPRDWQATRATAEVS